MGIRELKKRNRSKLLFGGVDIKKYASVDYIRDLLKHRREDLERPQDVDVTEGTIDPEDVDVAVEDPVDPGDVVLEQDTNPPAAIDAALATVANLTNQLATTLPEQPNNQLDISNGDVLPSSSVDVLPSSSVDVLPSSSVDVVESDIHPTDAALNSVSQLVGTFEKPDEEQFSESEPDEEPTIGTQSMSENPAIVALNLISGIVAELAVPPVTGPPGPVQSGPTDEALDNILKFTQSLVSPLSTQTPPIIETPPTQPNTSSSFLPKFSASGMLSGMLSGLNSLLPDDEDMTQYEVEEYTTALGSDIKQNERKTMYNSDGATSGQHKWRAPPAPANQSSQA